MFHVFFCCTAETHIHVLHRSRFDERIQCSALTKAQSFYFYNASNHHLKLWTTFSLHPSKNTKSGSLCNVGGQLRIDDSYSTSRSRITLVIDWFKTLNKARYHNDGNVNQLSACSFLSRMAAVSSSVKYWRAILDCTFTVGPLGFGRCVSTALIGSVYLWEAVRNQTGSRKRPEQLTSLHHNHTLWESIWLLCVGVFWYRVNLPEANCGNRRICDWKIMWTCKWDDMTCNWPTDNEESPVRVRRR